MISDKLKQDALDFLSAVEAVAKDEGYQAAKKEFDAELAKAKAEYDDKVKKAYDLGLYEGYNKHKSEVEASGDVTPTDPDTPIDVPSNDPVNEGYSREKVVEELLAIKGSKSCAFGIVDVMGNVYANEDEWVLDGKPQVLGIGYTDGKHHLCMSPKKVGAAVFGGNGVNFGKKVHTTKRQWHKDTTATENAAWDDYSGESNTLGIREGCDGSIAAKCMEYMPACAELRVYCKYFKEVDVLLKAVGGDVLKVQNGAYLLWSSTCRDANNAWCVRFMNEGDAQPAYRSKTTILFTRQFIVL